MISVPYDKKSRLWIPLFVIGALLLTVLVLEIISSGEYSITPGTSTPVAPLIKISGVATNSHPGRLNLTDVYLQPLSQWQLFLTHFQSHVQVVPADELTEPGVSTAELTSQGYLEMHDAKQAAEVAAFRAVGWAVPATPTGTVITAVEDNSPASRAGLAVGDIITALNHSTVSFELFVDRPLPRRGSGSDRDAERRQGEDLGHRIVSLRRALTGARDDRRAAERRQFEQRVWDERAREVLDRRGA